MKKEKPLQVAVAGRLASTTHRAFGRLLQRHNMHLVDSLSAGTQVLVLGNHDDNSRKKRQALAGGNKSLKIVNEADFFVRYLGHRAYSSLYTLGQIARILGVEESRLRSMMRHKIVQPEKRQGRLSWFSYPAIAEIRAILELQKNQVSTRKIKKGLKSRARWSNRPLSTSSLYQKIPVIKVGAAIFTTEGQQLINFGNTAGSQAIPAEKTPGGATSALNFFEKAIAAEETGQVARAIEYYEKVIELDNKFTEAHYNLGNLYYSCRQKALAASRFLRAVELEADFVEAWNNLGNCLVDLKEEREAVRAFRKALSLQPDYADAHYNLAFTLFKAGELKKARRHFIRYLSFDNQSPMASEVNQLLATINSSLE